MNQVSPLKEAVKNIQQILEQLFGYKDKEEIIKLVGRILKEGPCVLEVEKQNFLKSFEHAYGRIVNNKPYQQYLKERILSFSQNPESTANQNESFRNSKKQATEEIKAILFQTFPEGVADRDERIFNLSQKLLEEGPIGLESERKALGEKFLQTQLDLSRSTGFQSFLKECQLSLVPQVNSNVPFEDPQKELNNPSLCKNVLSNTASRKKKEDKRKGKEEEKEERIAETTETVIDSSCVDLPYPYCEEYPNLEESEISRIADLLTEAFFEKLRNGHELDFLKKEILEASMDEEQMYKIFLRCLCPFFPSLKKSVKDERDRKMLNDNEKLFYSSLCGDLAYCAGFTLYLWARDT